MTRKASIATSTAPKQAAARRPHGRSELAGVMAILAGDLPTAIQQVNYPIHKGLPNPKHGKFFFVGSIPDNCYDANHDNGPFSPKGRSRYYDTQAEAISAAQAGGAKRIQRTDCSFV